MQNLGEWLMESIGSGRSHRTFTVCVLTVAMVAESFAQEWSEGFEAGMGSAKTYSPTTHGTTLEIGRDRPAEGKQYIRAVLPGKKRLEGLNVTAR